MGEKDASLDGFFAGAKSWGAEIRALRAIVLEHELREQRKWRWPCYMREGKNIVLIHCFKEYCALLFFKGAVLNDPGGLLVRQTENVQAGRQLRFASEAEIRSARKTIHALVEQAIAAEKAGLRPPKAKPADMALPQEFADALAERPELKAAFAALTPGRQRAYLLHLSGAKQAKTRLSRIEACAPRILAGKGMDD